MQAPPMVCLQWCSADSRYGRPEVLAAWDPATRRQVRDWLEDPSVSFSAFHAAFDWAVVAAWDNSTIPSIFAAYAADRIGCTKLRERLDDTARGKLDLPGRGYDLGSVTARRLGPRSDGRPWVDKSDPWRVRYGTLYGVPISQWPTDALAYAEADATTERALWEHGTAAPYANLHDEYRQARAGFALRLLECRGMRTDRDTVDRYYAEIREELEASTRTAREAGLLRHSGKRNTAAARERMERACAALEIEVPRTEKGAIALDKDAIANLGGHDPVLEAYGIVTSNVSTMGRIERLYRGTRLPLQSSYEVIKATGRTSVRQGKAAPTGAEVPPAWGFQSQNLPRKSSTPTSMRECFVPREGYYLCSVDYGAIELCTWAQICRWVCGFSRLGDTINAGDDPHTMLGARLAGITYEQARALTGAERQAFRSKYRQLAKPLNFGLPGGMGAASLQAILRIQERVIVTIEYARELIDAWRETWPEAPEYFRWVSGQIDPAIDMAWITHFVSGRIRGPIYYTAACNSPFQGLASDLAKDALFRVQSEAYADPRSGLYGTRPVAYVHDEILAEVPIATAHEAAHRMAEIMVETAQQWVPDIRITAEPALMARWMKAAEPEYDTHGRLVPWGTRELEAA